MLPVLVAALALVVGAGCAAKQPARSFVDLQQRLHSGNTVYVIDDTGHETKGRHRLVDPRAPAGVSGAWPSLAIAEASRGVAWRGADDCRPRRHADRGPVKGDLGRCLSR